MHFFLYAVNPRSFFNKNHLFLRMLRTKIPNLEKITKPSADTKRHGSYKDFSKKNQVFFKDILHFFKDYFPRAPESFCFLLSAKVVQVSKNSVSCLLLILMAALFLCFALYSTILIFDQSLITIVTNHPVI